jgi:uncharacterized repeat protein (TIGR01451 family)
MSYTSKLEKIFWKMAHIFIIIVILCDIAPASTIHCDLQVISDNGTMSHYSYFKEPIVEESGYTRGLKAGSMSYLKDGEIDFKDNIWYYDGKIDAGHPKEIGVDHNSSYYENQSVDFTGQVGISEIYATGFFVSNRAVSAWKKVRYDYATSPKITKFSHDNASPTIIKATTEVGMGNRDFTGMAGDYDFDYRADVTNGLLEMRDSTGWTNKSASRRIDWEQAVLIKGNAKVVNHLIAYNLTFPGAGAFPDWLPCCFASTIPPLEGLDSGWPNSGTFGTLKPDKILPSCTKECSEICESEKCKNLKSPAECKSCSQECLKDCNWKCEKNNCQGYECINTYNTEIYPETFNIAPTKQVGKMEIVKRIIKINDVPMKIAGRPERRIQDVSVGDRIEYEVEISHNDGRNPLKEVTVVDELPVGLKYEVGSSYLNHEIPGGGETNKIPLEPEPEGSLSLTWKLPEAIPPSLSAYINLTVIVENNGTRDLAYKNIASAEGVFEIGPVRNKMSAKTTVFDPGIPP